MRFSSRSDISGIIITGLISLLVEYRKLSLNGQHRIADYSRQRLWYMIKVDEFFRRTELKTSKLVRDCPFDTHQSLLWRREKPCLYSVNWAIKQVENCFVIPVKILLRTYPFNDYRIHSFASVRFRP